MAASNLYLGKASGGVLNVQPADGTTNTSIVLPASGTVTTNEYVNSNNLGNGSTTFNGFGGSGFKNYIINGRFDIWQRATSFTGQYNIYLADRWQHISSNAATAINASRSTDVPAGSGFTYSINFGATNTSYATYLTQRIEDVLSLAGKTITISFWGKCNIGTMLQTIYIGNNYGYGGSNYEATSSQQITLTTTWQKFTLTFNVLTASGKTIGTSSFIDLNIKQPLSTQGVFLTGLQLEEGSVATPFEQRPYGLELSLCQRYFEQCFIISYNTSTWLTTNTQSYKVIKRIVPTVTILSSYDSAVGYTAEFNNASVFVANRPSLLNTNTVSEFWIISPNGGYVAGNHQKATILASAEL